MSTRGFVGLVVAHRGYHFCIPGSLGITMCANSRQAYTHAHAMCDDKRLGSDDKRWSVLISQSHAYVYFRRRTDEKAAKQSRDRIVLSFS